MGYEHGRRALPYHARRVGRRRELVSMLLDRPLVLYLCGQLILNIRILSLNEALRRELLDVLGEGPGAVIVHQLGGCHLLLALGYVHFE